MAANQNTWRFSETRDIQPFYTSDKGLSDVGFRISPEEEFVLESVVDLDDQEGLHSGWVRPEFKLSVDAEAIETDTGIEQDRQRLCLVLRDPALWRSELLETWAVTEIPETFKICAETLRSTSGYRGLEIALQVTPTRFLDRSGWYANRPDHVICERTFKIRVPSEGADFPVQLVPESFFTDRHYPGGTTWALEWYETDNFDQSADSILMLAVREDVGEKIQRHRSRDPFAKVIWRSIAIEAYAEIATYVFSQTPPEPEVKHSLLQSLNRVVGGNLGVSHQDLCRLAKSPEGYSRFRSAVQTELSLNEAIIGI